MTRQGAAWHSGGRAQGKPRSRMQSASEKKRQEYPRARPFGIAHSDSRGIGREKAQRTIWLAVWIVAGDIYLRRSQRFWRKSRLTTSQGGNVEFQQHVTLIKSVARQMGMSSWPRRRSGTPPLFLASYKRRRIRSPARGTGARPRGHQCPVNPAERTITNVRDRKARAMCRHPPVSEIRESQGPTKSTCHGRLVKISFCN